MTDCKGPCRVAGTLTCGVLLGVRCVGEEALEGVARGPIGVGGRLGPELHCEVIAGHVDHARVEGVVVGELQAPRLQPRPALQPHHKAHALITEHRMGKSPMLGLKA